MVLAGYVAKYKEQPNYASYQMAQAFLGVKAAWEKAQDANGGKPERTSRSRRRSRARPSKARRHGAHGHRRGHQAIMETAYGTTKLDKGKLTVVNVKRYPAEQVNPPDGVKSSWTDFSGQAVDPLLSVGVDGVIYSGVAVHGWRWG